MCGWHSHICYGGEEFALALRKNSKYHMRKAHLKWYTESCSSWSKKYFRLLRRKLQCKPSFVIQRFGYTSTTDQYTFSINNKNGILLTVTTYIWGACNYFLHIKWKFKHLGHGKEFRTNRILKHRLIKLISFFQISHGLWFMI